MVVRQNTGLGLYYECSGEAPSVLTGESHGPTYVSVAWRLEGGRARVDARGA